jgi:hypothetical protein
VVVKHIDQALFRNSRVQPPSEEKVYNQGNRQKEDSTTKDTAYKVKRNINDGKSKIGQKNLTDNSTRIASVNDS